MAGWSISFSPKAEKELLALPHELSGRILEKLEWAKQDPLRYFERLKDREDYKMRVGDYRIIADINFPLGRIGITKNWASKEYL